MAVAGLLFTVIWFPLLGLALTRVVGRMNLFLAGAGVNGLVLFVTGTLHVPLIPVLVLLAIVAVVVLLRIPAPRSRETNGDQRVYADIVLAAAILYLLVVSALTRFEDFDGRAFWLLKAKAIAHELSVDGPFFHGQTTYSPRNEYPLLLPIDAATIMIAVRDLDDRHVRWLYTMLAIALALEVRHRAGPWYGALTLWLPQIAIAPEGGALTAYADIAVAAFVACAVFELASEDPSAIRYGLWLSFLVLTKDEGLPFALVLLLLAVTLLPKPKALLAAVPAGIAVAALLYWRSGIEPTDENPFVMTDILARTDRIAEVLRALGQHVLAFSDWGVLWIAVAFAAAALAWRREWRVLLIGLGPIVVMLAVYVLMYLASSWVTRDLVNATAPRLLSHFIGPGMLLLSRYSTVTLLARLRG